MNNPLYVQFKEDPAIYTFFVAIGNKIKEVIADLEHETNRTIEKASYNKF
jgi:hypothetical protein